MTVFKNRAQWKDRLRQKWSGSLRPEGTIALPAPTAQHYQENEDGRFRREHGFAPATRPAEWSADITEHNTAVQQEYAAEVERLKAAYSVGEYHPRFFCDVWDAGISEYVATPNWDLEMTLRPGGRVNVTKDPGVPMQPTLTEADVQQAREIGMLGREVNALETDPIRRYVGTRQEILRACGGDERIADEVEAKARELMNDANLPERMARAVEEDRR